MLMLLRALNAFWAGKAKAASTPEEKAWKSEREKIHTPGGSYDPQSPAVHKTLFDKEEVQGFGPGSAREHW